ncbi:MAG: tRNA (adenosine(37)-N6)-threonylcarbamoyltransferase complex ATPase subunit type 1 TsaE [Alphaproteobacteria bacterium]|nr:tRNA (adenosine(37)-N6)-threonylcarbamoyltransferase complex ATPase subunit type 1 TsaE [Alphaproteobacteria bacterium]MDE1985572.1 tRNA (adenosine(37)-N6)-threonylcarbamoyltransferase complex ATPase subunit type 1 TsaE [Alphaproteobacteria bacterium]MDE2162193.1 tRNA (adenosine(37)-N6)-threonylcarbamoyltransferase complex ATPase subunit type 1 TsaE [Alphaproteobacteria bacterium]MDE2265306.1 tRNA (adenosine(37)-N6)-threonylcarbamoyltransferase complex ATPase subunit type 1 TsaE [Alphaproteob
MTTDSQSFTRRIALADPTATMALGTMIATRLQVGDTVALKGDLGAGKTTLARAILRTLAVTENVPSPTFTLVQTYETPGLPIRHYDLYRVENPREIDELGLDEALEEGAVLIEWPEHAGNHIPDDALQITLITTGAQSRLADITGPARWASIFREDAHAR